MVKVTKQLYVTNRKEWRNWLEENYSTANEIWLVYNKKKYVFWITSAKRKPTRKKRIIETVKLSALNRKPGMN